MRYRIAGNFCELEGCADKTFLVPPIMQAIRKDFTDGPKTMKFSRFSPSKVSRFTVVQLCCASCAMLHIVLLFVRLGTGYVNVAEEFYSSPEAWLDRRYPHTHRSAPPHTLPPTHLVMFNTLIQVHTLCIS